MGEVQGRRLLRVLGIFIIEGSERFPRGTDTPLINDITAAWHLH